MNTTFYQISQAHNQLRCGSGASATLSAFQEEHELLHIDSNLIEVCNMCAFSHQLRTASDLDLKNVLLASLTLDSPLLSGEGATHPSIAPLLQEFCDVLVPKMPGGLPPERVGLHGLPLEHTIETAPREKTYARPPRPFTADEMKEMIRYLHEFL